jgi:hypothetical protein
MRSKKTGAQDIARCNDVDWETVIIPTRPKASRYLRLQPGNTYVLRLFANPMRIYRYFLNGRSAITDDPDTCPMRTVAPAIRPLVRYAHIVLDRQDEGAVKIVEFSEPLFNYIAGASRKKGINPGAACAPDISISVNGVGISICYGVEFSTTATVFSEDEVQRIRQLHQIGFTLDELFRPTPSIAAVLGFE